MNEKYANNILDVRGQVSRMLEERIYILCLRSLSKQIIAGHVRFG